MSETEKTIENLNTAKLILCNQQMLTSEMRIRIGQAITDAITLLKEQEAVVRCKDCKYAHLTYDGECKYCDMDKDEYGNIEAKYKPGDWFCAGGERKEGR